MILRLSLIFLTLVISQLHAAGDNSPKLESPLSLPPNLENHDVSLLAELQSAPGLFLLSKSFSLDLGYIGGKYHTDEEVPVGAVGFRGSLISKNHFAHELALQMIGSKIIGVNYFYRRFFYEQVRFRPSLIMGLSQNLLAEDGVAGFVSLDELQLAAGFNLEWQMKKILSNFSQAESLQLYSVLASGTKNTSYRIFLGYTFYWP